MATKEQDPSSVTPTFEFSKEKARLEALLADWNRAEGPAANIRREVRRFDNNVEALQTEGKISAADTKIPRRQIHNNIAREKPGYVAYVEQSSRLVLFKSRSEPGKETNPLADWFTTGMRYPGWNTPWHSAVDGAILHGGTFIEVRVDQSKPLGLALESVPRECLIFPTKTRKDIQRCEKIMRKYEYLPNELEDAVEDFGFSATQVNRLTEKTKNGSREVPIEVYKVFFKQKGKVHVAWWNSSCDEWLKDPAPLSFGEVDPAGTQKPLDCFPFFWLGYDIIEDELLLSIKGRAALDLADQDALTMLWSAVVNGANRAAQIYASQKFSPENPSGQENMVLAPGVANTRELNFHQMSYPDPMLLTVAQSLSSENMAQSGQVDFAVNNRKDSRKTAREIASAQDQAGLLTSVKLVPFANCIRAVYGFCWRIVQAFVKLGVIIPPNNVALYFDDTYDILSAGDTEVIQRAEKIQALQMFYAVVQNTPVGPMILSKLIELQFPDEAPKWVPLLAKPDLAPITAALAQTLAAVPRDNLTPEQQGNLDNLLSHASSVLQSSSLQAGSPALAANPSNGNAPQGSESAE